MSNAYDKIHALPIWKGDVHIEPLAGGITNTNFTVTDTTGGYVVRFGDDIPVHHILRRHETAASRAAHAAGVAPEVVYSGDGILVLEYIESKTLTESDVRDDPTLDRIVDLVKLGHRDIPEHLAGAALVFWVFHVIRDYARTLRDADSAHRGALNELLAAARLLEASAGPFDIVFGHNDLLAANLLDDGSRIWLVDWEYAGFNTPLFDLGGLATNNELSERQEHRMLERYFERPVSDALIGRYQAMKCASLLRETMWSMVSEIYSTIDFDYAAYTRENRRRFDDAYAEFER